MNSSFFKSIWSFRGFILGSVSREFQQKYRNSLLGAAWPVINPLAMILVYTVIFSQVMRAKLNGTDSGFSYSIYLCAGILNWGFFSEIIVKSQNVFIENANLMKKLKFPRICLPISVVMTATLNFVIVFFIFTLFLIFSGNFPGWVFLSLIPLWIILILFSVGLGICLGVLNVFFRDVGYLFGIVLQFWFWLTPVVYPVSILPEKIRPFLVLNPMAELIIAFQEVLANHHWPDWGSLQLVSLLSFIFCTAGFRLFRSHSAEMVDEL